MRSEQGGCRVVVGQKDIGAQGWRWAQAAGVLEMQQRCDLGMLLRPGGLYRDPRSRLAAIVDCVESVQQVL